MANILDIRRRIRSVINTRQITRAMKMVPRPGLRRAQERALAARPYAQMLTNVLKSLVSRADIFDPATGEVLHPFWSGGLSRMFCWLLSQAIKDWQALSMRIFSNLHRGFIESKTGKNIEIEAIGRKGRDFLRRGSPARLKPQGRFQDHRPLRWLASRSVF